MDGGVLVWSLCGSLCADLGQDRRAGERMFLAWFLVLVHGGDEAAGQMAEIVSAVGPTISCLPNPKDGLG